jgi:hypothetical protein
VAMPAILLLASWYSCVSLRGSVRRPACGNVVACGVCKYPLDCEVFCEGLVDTLG